MPLEVTPPDRTRLWIGLFVAGAAILVAGASFFAVLWILLVTCGGDGGYPYSPRDSTTGRACAVMDDHEWLYLAQLATPAVVTIGLGILAARLRSWSVSWVALVLGAAFAIGPAFVLEGLPDSCSDEDAKVFNEWVENGGRGPMPADCETY